MRDKDLYSRILGIKSPWQVVDVELALGAGKVEVYVEHDPGYHADLSDLWSGLCGL